MTTNTKLFEFAIKGSVIFTAQKHFAGEKSFIRSKRGITRWGRVSGTDGT
jgi:hypothetical protein